MHLLSVHNFQVKLIKIYIFLWRADRKNTSSYIYSIMNKEKMFGMFYNYYRKKTQKTPLNSFTLFTTLHKKLNQCVPTHSRGKTLIFSRLHFVLMQRDSSVLYSQTLFLRNGPRALHSQHLYSLVLRSKMSEPLVSSDLDFLDSNAINNGSRSPTKESNG